MAKTSNKRITGVNTGTIAMFEGTFAAILGLGIAIMYSLNATVRFADSTNSVLRGLAFGLTTGIISIIVLPFIYFAFGWLIGLVHGFVFNVVAHSSGGIVIDMQDE